MADYFVSKARGSNSTGTGTASNPWASIGKAIGTSPAITMSGSGTDRLYIEPGTYFETVTLALTPTSGNPLEIIGDCDGAGFVAGGYSTPITGVVVDWSAWSSETAVSSSPCLTGGTKSYVTLRNLKMLGGNVSAGTGSCVDVTSGQSWSILDCTLHAGQNYPATRFGSAAEPAAAGLNLTVDRCDFLLPSSNAIAVVINAVEAASEYSLGSVVKHCRAVGGGGVVLAKVAASGGALGTGLTVEYCTFLLSNATSGGVGIYIPETIVMTSPIVIRGCVITGAAGVACGHASHTAENWNAFRCFSVTRSKVTAGANSLSTFRPAFDWDDGRLTGLPLRPFGEPSLGAGLRGLTASGTDLIGRPRPSGYGVTTGNSGALERGQCGRKETTTTDGDAASIAIDGPGVHRFQVPVKTGSQSITIKGRYDTNHGGTNKPRATLLACPECGISSDVVGTMTVSANTWETLTISYTGTATGWAWLRLESRSAAGNGIAYFDSFSG